MPASDDNELGYVGKYRLVRLLARGGMAEIYVAKQPGPAGFERTVVVKRVLSSFSQDPTWVGMFLDEVRIAAQLSHPNIVQTFDFGEADGVHFVCMEYLAGEDLLAVVSKLNERGVRIPVDLAAWLVAQAASGLEYAHQFVDETGKHLNIVHRDVTPANLFATYAGGLKIIDFGIAAGEGRLQLTQAGYVKGKLRYMSPEQLQGGRVDLRSDVWALGAVLYYLLTSHEAFEAKTQERIIERILAGRPTPLATRDPALPSELEAIIQRALGQDRRDRFQSMAGFRTALVPFFGDGETAQLRWTRFLRDSLGEEHIQERLRQAQEPSAPQKGAEGPTPGGDPDSFGSEPTRLSAPPVREQTMGVATLLEMPGSLPAAASGPPAARADPGSGTVSVVTVREGPRSSAPPTREQPEVLAPAKTLVFEKEDLEAAAPPSAGTSADRSASESSVPTLRDAPARGRVAVALAIGAVLAVAIAWVASSPSSQGAAPFEPSQTDAAQPGLVAAGPPEVDAGPETLPPEEAPPSIEPAPPKPKAPVVKRSPRPPAPVGKGRLLLTIVDCMRAEVFIDGASLGQNRPTTPFELEAGNHHLELKHPLCLPFKKSIRIEPNVDLKEVVTVKRR